MLFIDKVEDSQIYFEVIKVQRMWLKCMCIHFILHLICIGIIKSRGCLQKQYIKSLLTVIHISKFIVILCYIQRRYYFHLLS